MKNPPVPAVGVICFKGARVLLIKRSKPADFGSHHFILHDYLAVWESGEVRAGDDAADARWFELTEIEALGMWPKTQAVIFQAYAALTEPS